jgi:hypothetical protein
MRAFALLMLWPLALLRAESPFLDGNYCVPNTLCAMGRLHGGSVTAQQFAETCRSDKVTGTDFAGITQAWRTRYPRLKLHNIYAPDTADAPSGDPKLEGLVQTVRKLQEGLPLEDTPLLSGHPYLWIGILQGGGHCALVEFSADGESATFTHSQPSKGGKPVRTTMPLREFFLHTLIVLDVSDD